MSRKIKPGFYYPSWRATGFHYPSTRPVLTGIGNRSPVNSGSGNRTLFLRPYFLLSAGLLKILTRSSAVAETPRDALSYEIRTRGRSRSLEIVPMSRVDTCSYQSSVLTLSLSCMVYNHILLWHHKFSTLVSYLAPPMTGSPKIYAPCLVPLNRRLQSCLIV